MNRHAAEKRGRGAETLACWYLRLRGWRILARRARVPGGESMAEAQQRAVIEKLRQGENDKFSFARIEQTFRGALEENGFRADVPVRITAERAGGELVVQLRRAGVAVGGLLAVGVVDGRRLRVDELVRVTGFEPR